MIFPSAMQVINIAGRQVRLMVPDAAAVRTAYESGAIDFPYWSKLWPSAIALSIFLVQHTAYSKNKKVLEVGAGLGLPSLVAATNAAEVLCTDVAPQAVALAKASAMHAGLQNFTTAVFNWQQDILPLAADLLLLSDVNYKPADFAALLQMVEAFLTGGQTIILSTTQRLAGREFIAPLLSYCIHKEDITVMENGQEQMITVMVLGRKELRD